MKLLNRKRHVDTATVGSPADAAELSSVLGPASVVNLPRHVQVGDGYASNLIVTGYPAQVGAAWLDPLLAWPGRLDVVVYIDPLTPQAAAGRLRRQRARLEANRRTDTEKGRLLDPAPRPPPTPPPNWPTASPAANPRCSGSGYLCVHAPSLQELQESVAHVRAVAASVLLDVQPATWRCGQGVIAAFAAGLRSASRRCSRTFAGWCGHLRAAPSRGGAPPASRPGG